MDKLIEFAKRILGPNYKPLADGPKGWRMAVDGLRLLCSHNDLAAAPGAEQRKLLCELWLYAYDLHEARAEDAADVWILTTARGL